MKHIAFISTMDTDRWGGSEELWYRTATTLAQDGLAVSANVWRWNPPARQIEALKALGCRVMERRTVRRLKPLIGNLAEVRCARWLATVKPDLVVLSLSYHTEGVEWMQACREYRLPYVLIIQSAGEVFWPTDADAAELAKGYEAALACYFVSHGNLEFVRTQIATPLPRARVVRNPFNVDYDATPLWPHPSEQDNSWKLACVGRLQSMAKGQDLLLKVMSAEKWKRRPLHVTLYGVGPNEATLATFKTLHQLDHVQFGGFNTDIETLWASHHGLVLPSRYEGLPLVVVEAMLCGRMCVVTDVSGNAELVEDNVTGFVAAGASCQQLDAALERAWARRGEWRQIGELAARAIRLQVPRDPARVMATELMGIEC